MRIARTPVNRVARLPIRQIGRHVGLADEDRTCALEPLDDERIALGDVVGEPFVAPAGGQAGDIETFLDRHRHAEQRPIVARRLPVERLGSGARTFEIAHDDRVDLHVAILDPRDCGFHRLAR